MNHFDATRWNGRNTEVTVDSKSTSKHNCKCATAIFCRHRKNWKRCRIEFNSVFQQKRKIWTHSKYHQSEQIFLYIHRRRRLCRRYIVLNRISAIRIWMYSSGCLCRINTNNLWLCVDNQTKNKKIVAKLLFAFAGFVFPTLSTLNGTAQAHRFILPLLRIYSMCFSVVTRRVDLSLCRCELARRLWSIWFLIVLFTFWTHFRDHSQNRRISHSPHMNWK